MIMSEMPAGRGPSEQPELGDDNDQALNVNDPMEIASSTDFTQAMEASSSVPAPCLPSSTSSNPPLVPPSTSRPPQTFPLQIPPIRGPHAAQILQNAAEMIARARAIQQQRMQQYQQQQQQQQQQQGPHIAFNALPPIRTTREEGVEQRDVVSSQQAATSLLKRKKEGEDEQSQFKTQLGTVMGVPVDTHTEPQTAGREIEPDVGATEEHQLVTSPHLSGIFATSGELPGDSEVDDDEVDDDEIDELEEASSGKKARLVWSQELHNRFLNALSHLGLKHAVPKTILTMMNVDGMTRENVASHLQKYRLHLKKMGGYDEKERVDSEVLQRLHEQNIRHLAAQQASHMATYQPINGSSGMYNAPYQSTGLEVVEGIPVYPELADLGSGSIPSIHLASGLSFPSVVPAPTTTTALPVSPTVTAAVEAGGRFNPLGWQYPTLPVLDHHGSQQQQPPREASPEDTVNVGTLMEDDQIVNRQLDDRDEPNDDCINQDEDDRCPLIAALPSMNDLEVAESLQPQRPPPSEGSR